MSITEAIGILEHLDTPVLEIVLDQTRIAYRVQEACKVSASAAGCRTSPTVSSVIATIKAKGRSLTDTRAGRRKTTSLMESASRRITFASGALTAIRPVTVTRKRNEFS